MNKYQIYTVSSLLIILSLILIVYGFSVNAKWIWSAGLLSITVSMLLSLYTHWLEDEE